MKFIAKGILYVAGWCGGMFLFIEFMDKLVIPTVRGLLGVR